MKWRKLGLIYCASGENEYMQTGGRAPVPVHLHDDIWRIFYAAYDTYGRGRIFFLDILLTDTVKIIQKIETPVINFCNTLGTYDDNGIIPSCAVIYDDKLYLYTIGFSIKNKFTFDASTGLAISSDMGRTFKKFPGPILTWSFFDPIFAASPSVLRIDNLWHMWYVSGKCWVEEHGVRKHYYNIKHKISIDGIIFDNHATTSIDFANEYEYAIARPCVLYHNGLLKMWYSFRGQPGIDTYRIGYAESTDGEHWIRLDNQMREFDVEADGWDSEMVCYSYVFEHNATLYMLYNGNHYGKTGFGLAVLE